MHCIGFRLDDKVDNYTFSKRGYKLTRHVRRKYVGVRKLFKECIMILRRYKIVMGKPAESSIHGLLECIKFYEESENAVLVLLSEVVKSKNDLKMKEAAFVLLEKIVKMFYAFDITRNNKPSIFHDYIFVRDSLNPVMADAIIAKISAFVSMAMPMAHLFLSCFYTNSIEIYTPSALSKRNAIYIDREKMDTIRAICRTLAVNGQGHYIAMYMLSVYSRLSGSADLERRMLQTMGAQMVAYYDEMRMII